MMVTIITIYTNGVYEESYLNETAVMEQLPSGSSTGFPSKSPVFKTTGWFQGQPSLSSFWEWPDEYQEYLGT